MGQQLWTAPKGFCAFSHVFAVFLHPPLCYSVKILKECFDPYRPDGWNDQDVSFQAERIGGVDFDPTFRAS
jgi:hypothetical protein